MADAAAPAKPAQQLAPGVILGPDGKPCKPCMAFRSFAGVKKKQPAASSSSPSSTAPSSSSASAATAAFAGSAVAAASDEPVLPADCPPDVERLGRHTWTFLHTTASYFPPSPSAHQKSSMLSLIRALPTLYPCGSCASHLGAYLETHPPEPAVEKGREALEGWLCGVHNEVNERLGKERFDCGDVPQRWRDGWKDGRCDP
ncbi:Flavin-linked sulfhydryl oxidase of the mitochondrial IMS [Rhodotorula kratochvilovae]